HREHGAAMPTRAGLRAEEPQTRFAAPRRAYYFSVPSHSLTPSVGDVADVVHGHEQVSLFNGHYDERCFLPIHVYDTATSRPVAVLLRPGKTPSGDEVRRHLRRLVHRIRSH